MIGVTSPRVHSHPGRVRRAHAARRGAITAALVVVWVLWLLPTGLGGPVGLIWVSGTSMQPSMHTGDLAMTYRQDSYDVGDVVAFEIPGGGTVIHRIIEVEPDGYRFQGDNRDFADPWVLGDEAIVGRRVFHLPHAGSVLTMLGHPATMGAAVAALVLLQARRPDRPRTRGDRVPTTAGSS